MVFVVPLKQVCRGLDRGRLGAVAGPFELSKCHRIEEETLAGCDMPCEFQRAFGRRIWFPATVVLWYSFNHPPRSLVFISYLGEIYFIEQKGRLFWVHYWNLSRITVGRIRSLRRRSYHPILCSAPPADTHTADAGRRLPWRGCYPHT